MSPTLSNRLNAIALLALAGVLAGAFVEQLLFRELPCPLCLLQRAGFAVVGVGLCLNVLCGPRPAHYGLMIGGAVIGGSVSLRQIALHIVPGTGAYGGAIFGLHLYTWAFLIFGAVVIGAAIMMLFERQFPAPGEAAPAAGHRTALGLFAAGVFAVAVAGNVVSTVLECGGGLCPDNPTRYELLDDLEAAGGGAANSD